MQAIYPYFIKFHIIFSSFFILLALAISVHSFVGWQWNKSYGSFENRFRKLFVVTLYIDLLLGILLYFFLKKPEDLITPEQAMRYSTLRFWAIQHFSNMLFVVIISQIGSILITKTNIEIKKFKYSFLYFGVSTLITLISVGLFAFRK